jgi:sterol desaturase/sphingolipid hydroxylase (fatty acid hydroxylase superfamily)
MAARRGSWLFFPVVLGVALIAGERIVAAGGQPIAVLAGSAGVVLLAERLFPHSGAWQRGRGDVGVDLAHVVSVSLASLATQLAVPALLSPFGAAQLWPASWPLLAQLPLALVAAELFQYWSHRLSHEWEPLWRLHATHHSAPRLYFLNAARFHSLDIVIDTTAGLLPLVLLGCPAPVQALFALFTGVFGYLQHCNVRVALGPLNYVFSMAELHRWPEQIGIPGLPAFPASYWGQLASPLRWRAIQRASGAQGAAAPTP